MDTRSLNFSIGPLSNITVSFPRFPNPRATFHPIFPLPRIAFPIIPNILPSSFPLPIGKSSPIIPIHHNLIPDNFLIITKQSFKPIIITNHHSIPRFTFILHLPKIQTKPFFIYYSKFRTFYQIINHYIRICCLIRFNKIWDFCLI